MPRLLSQSLDPHSLHVPARCHCCAAVTTPFQTPSPSFLPSPPRSASTRPAAVLCPPAMLTGCVASARCWVGGRNRAGRGRSWRSGRGIKPGLFLYCKVITRAFQSLICREHPGVIGSFPQAWQQFPHHTSPASKPRKLPHLGSHWDTCAAELPARLPRTSSSPWPGTGMGTLVGTLVYSWEHLTAKPVEWDAALTTWLSCWLDLDPSTVNTLNPCFPHHLPPKGF